jgi:hypothetical protein
MGRLFKASKRVRDWGGPADCKWCNEDERREKEEVKYDDMKWDGEVNNDGQGRAARGGIKAGEIWIY